jgi:hypothetical protein
MVLVLSGVPGFVDFERASCAVSLSHAPCCLLPACTSAWMNALKKIVMLNLYRSSDVLQSPSKKQEG